MVGLTVGMIESLHKFFLHSVSVYPFQNFTSKVDFFYLIKQNKTHNLKHNLCFQQRLFTTS